jgi:CspA family cold shock protein
MNFKDRWETDANGKKFIFTIEMQRKLADNGLPIEPESLAQLNESTPAVIKKVEQKSEPQKEVAQQPVESAATSGSSFEEPESIQIDPETGKYIGRVKWYNVSKGYGFISRGGGEDIFFHKTDTICDTNELNEGVWILYDVEETNKGLEASEVEIYTNAQT